VTASNGGRLAGAAAVVHGTGIALPGSSGVWIGNRRAFVACSKL
jgi:hypothetical protein